MTPSHATKSRRRYRYYITRPDQLDGTRAWRVSAHDLEELVCSNLAAKLAEGQFIYELAGSTDPSAEQFQAATCESDLIAATLRSGHASAKAELLDQFIKQVRLREDQVQVELDGLAIAERLGLKTVSEAPETLLITIPAVQIRRGHQLRLIVPGPEVAAPMPRRRDSKLVALIVEAHQAKTLMLANPEKSIATIAREQGRCRTRLRKLVALACLAPDVVTAIVEGRQPQQITAVRLMGTPLPLAWTDQRRELGLS
ncbi:hypothetical protein [Parafrankia sp. BMG5.11]|uniref:hypothetical protein n=1 Tax=Parafrankia sp. BMG5.11 TaxID=222540 RepID=UPI001A9D4B04|nr:hypothetical protein [Parafrankia sp. BMG5.11]